MTNLIAFLAALALQGAAPAPVAVLTECDASSDVAAQIPRDAAMDVHYSIAGAPTCYLVTVTVQGKALKGYVVDRGADAVVAFEKSRVESEQAAFKAPLPMPESAAAPVASVEPAKPAPAAVAAKVEKKSPPKQKVDM